MRRWVAGLLFLFLIPSTVHADVDNQGPKSLMKSAVAHEPAERLTPPPKVGVGQPGNPESWHDTAIAAGWTEAEWPWVRCVITGESLGDPNALNTRKNDRSYGLMQLNTKGSLWGWYQAHGVEYREQLFDPLFNLQMALVLRNEMRAAHQYPWGRHRCGL